MSFGNHLKATIKNTGMTYKSFAALVGSGTSSIANIVADRSTPPPLSVAYWADALDLHGAARDYFLQLAAAAHIPEAGGLRSALITVIEDSARLHRRLDDLEMGDEGLLTRLDQLATRDRHIDARMTALEDMERSLRTLLSTHLGSTGGIDDGHNTIAITHKILSLPDTTKSGDDTRSPENTN